MNIFSQPLRSFNIDRKSPFASDLKFAISAQLRLLCGSLFDDDILPEYVTVLVCNGKTQNQARDNLDAFLGEKSEAFVSWLWDFLLKNEQQCMVAVTLKDDNDILTSPLVPVRRNSSEETNDKDGDADSTSQKTNSVSREVINSPKRGLLSGVTSPLSESAQSRQMSGISKKRPSPSNVGGSLYCEKVRVSVWERLSGLDKASRSDVHTDNASKYMEGINDTGSPFVWSYKRKDNRGRSYNHNGMHNLSTNLLGGPAEGDTRKKRTFVQTTQSASSLVRGRCGDYHYKNQWQTNKRSKFVAKAPKDLILTVEEVKQRLQQMESEIYKLRAESIRMGNDTKNGSSMKSAKSSNGDSPKTGVTESTVEDVESRTVLVSNVHFAARRDALSLHFAKCGRVVDVSLLPDLSSFAPDSFVRSASITFASKESIDKALGLRGTVFYSRTLEISKLKEKNTLRGVSTSSPALSCTGQLVLQSSPASEQSALLGTRREVADSSEQPCSQPTTKDVAGYSDMLHIAESIGEKINEASACSVKDTTECTHMLNITASAVDENADKEAELSACGDQQSCLISSPVKEIARSSHHTEATTEAAEISPPLEDIATNEAADLCDTAPPES